MLKVDLINCTGCTACANICPKGAISFQEDDKGFRYPVINNELCIECGLCEKVCYTDRVSTTGRLKHTEYYIAKHKDPEELAHCQSVGAAFAFGEVAIRENGIVYGAYYENNNVLHGGFETKEGLIETCGSKYVQSDLNSCFTDISNKLKSRRKVLFTGTSCQVDGLYRYLENKKTDTTLLYTVDIICHGVPSPKILRDYISFVSKKTGVTFKSVNMRDRRYSPVTTTVFTAQDGKEYIENNYIDLFYTNIDLRECCGYCKFAKRDKPADITVGDTYGIDKKYHDILDKTNPSSLTIVHSEKGREMLKKPVWY